MFSRYGPAPILAIHALALIGVLFWISTIIQAVVAGLSDSWAVIPVGIVLGGAHVAISRLTARHDRRAVAVMWFVFISDALLAIFVNYLAVVLVLFTVVLLILARTSTAKEWFTSPNS
jgi:large-conductance mechanosensitive channel